MKVFEVSESVCQDPTSSTPPAVNFAPTSSCVCQHDLLSAHNQYRHYLTSMVLPRPQARTIKSAAFDPAQFLDTWPERSSELLPQNADLRTSIIKAFGLKDSDDYVYHAIASVTLAQVQHAVSRGAGENGMLHGWYRDSKGKQVMS